MIDDELPGACLEYLKPAKYARQRRGKHQGASDSPDGDAMPSFDHNAEEEKSERHLAHAHADDDESLADHLPLVCSCPVVKRQGALVLSEAMSCRDVDKQVV